MGEVVKTFFAMVIGSAIIITLAMVFGGWPIPAHAKMANLTTAERQEFMNLSPVERAARSQYFRDLKQPGSGASCCDISDCHFVDAKQEPDGTWMSHIPFDSPEWRPVPPDRVLTNKVSPSEDGKGIICHSAFPANYVPTVYCFIPPAMGY